MIDSASRTHLVLASGKLALQKIVLIYKNWTFFISCHLVAICLNLNFLSHLTFYKPNFFYIHGCLNLVLLQVSASKRLNERFLGRPGVRTVEPSVHDRLDRPRDPAHRGFDSRRLGARLPFAGHDSGDDLERDTGEDLRVELDGKRAANMVIQITRSPRKEVCIWRPWCNNK